MTSKKGAMTECNVCGVQYLVGSYSAHRLLPAHLVVKKAKERERTARARRAYRKRIGRRPFWVTPKRAPLIDVELLTSILMDFGYDVPADRSQRIAERYAEDAARLASESSSPARSDADQEARCDCAGWKVDCSCDFVRP